MNKKDLLIVTGLGAAIGVLSQAILGNLMDEVYRLFPAPSGTIRLAAFAFFTLLAPSALYIASIVGKLIPVLYQFAKFAAVGTLNTFVDLGVFNLETLLVGGQPSSTLFAVLKGISFLAGTTNSFFWNKYWTFGGAGDGKAVEVVKFYVIAIAGFFLNVGVATLVFRSGTPTEVWTNIVAPLSGVLSAFLWNFLGYKFLVFKKKPEITNI